MADQSKRKYGSMILMIGLLLIVTGGFLVYDYFNEKAQTAVVCGTDTVNKAIKTLKEEVSQKITEQADRVNHRLDFMTGFRDQRYR